MQDQQHRSLPPAISYSLPGILNYLQVEWRKFEKERNDWQVERSDLRARVAFLEGERKSMENLKSDLVKRVKMLEYALRKERSKSLADPNDQQAAAAAAAAASQTLRKGSIDMDIPLSGSNTINFSKGFGHSRSKEILKSYLKEADNLLAATKLSSPLKPSAGRIHEGNEDQSVPNTFTMPQSKPFSENSAHIEEDSRKELSKKRSTPHFISKPPLGISDELKREMVNTNRDNLPGNFETAGSKITTLKAAQEVKLKPVKNTVSLEKKAVAALDNTNYTTSIASPTLTNWTPSLPLRSHYDSIRSVAFHPTDTSIVTGSEDCTVKFWRISTSNNPSTENESRLVYTFKGHSAAVTSVAISSIESLCFSASIDSSIRVWSLPPLTRPAYSAHDTSLKIHTLIGHSDAVWEIQPHRSESLLLSCSADGTLKLWDVTMSNASLKSSFWYHGVRQEFVSDFEVPTSVCWGSGNDLISSYRNSIIKVFDAETHVNTLAFESDKSFDQTMHTQINQVVNHPTLALVISAHQDGEVRLFDKKSGKCVNSFLAHSDGVASISISPDGFTVITGGHDGAIKVWELNQLCPLQTLERLHGSSGDVWSIKHHKIYKNLVATGGSDAVLNILYNLQ